MHPETIRAYPCNPWLFLPRECDRDVRATLHSFLKDLLVVVSFATVPFVARQRHPFVGIDTQSIRDAVDVVEVADHLRGDGDLVVVESVGMQSFHVGLLHLSWI
jgi:hypothetical protein